MWSHCSKHVWKLHSKNKYNRVTGSKPRGWHLEVRGVGEAFPRKEEKHFRKSLCLGLTDPWNKEVKCRGNSEANIPQECQHRHTQLGQVNLIVPGTGQKKKCFWGKIFFPGKKKSNTAIKHCIFIPSLFQALCCRQCSPTDCQAGYRVPLHSAILIWLARYYFRAIKSSWNMLPINWIPFLTNDIICLIISSSTWNKLDTTGRIQQGLVPAQQLFIHCPMKDQDWGLQLSSLCWDKQKATRSVLGSCLP